MTFAIFHLMSWQLKSNEVQPDKKKPMNNIKLIC